MKQTPFEPGNYYHIFNRGNNKENLFKEKENYFYFLQLMKKHLINVYDIYAYCLLPNHFHLLIRIKDTIELPEKFSNGKRKISQPLSNCFNAYAKAINKRFNRTGSLFQEHPKRILVTSEEYFRTLVLYIHLNPENHGFESEFSKYLFSSYKAYETGAKSLLSREMVVDGFGGINNFLFMHRQKQMDSKIIQEIEEFDIFS